MASARPRFGGQNSMAATDISADSAANAPPAPDWTLPRRSRRGYDSDLVEDLFDRATHSYESVRRQRDTLSEELEALRGEVAELRAEQPLVQHALVSAHRTAREIVAQAETEADVLLEDAHRNEQSIVDNARNRADDVLREAEDERIRIEQQVARMRNLAKGLRADYRDLVERAVGMLEEGGPVDSVVEIHEPLTVAPISAPDA
jgi:cell division septum initiation protein DivIVA